MCHLVKEFRGMHAHYYTFFNPGKKAIKYVAKNKMKVPAN
jgi:hypothetical protein